jgi:DNA-binding transcriptional LysR family regulator
MFSIEQLEAFVTTVDLGSFSAAARHLKKAQSVISQHVMNLEIDAATALFDRTGRYPVLTKHGKKLLPFAKATLLQHQRLQNTALGLFDNPHSEISIAIDEGIPLVRISEAVSQLSAEIPNLQLEFISAASIDIIDLIESGRASVGLIFSELDLPERIDFECIGAIEFDVYVSTSHPLVKEKASNIDILRLHRQLIIRSRNTQSSTFQQALSPDIWYANIDIIQHQQYSHLPLFQRLRQVFRGLVRDNKQR